MSRLWGCFGGGIRKRWIRLIGGLARFRIRLERYSMVRFGPQNNRGFGKFSNKKVQDSVNQTWKLKYCRIKLQNKSKCQFALFSRMTSFSTSVWCPFHLIRCTSSSWSIPWYFTDVIIGVIFDDTLCRLAIKVRFDQRLLQNW
mmetsp:Transcript_21059/g.43345  ORF Transcript_21059/g.43345 Transcript_21059/m.43345 type:complete len:143 (+) Transcript_21059:55-483(+)